MSGKWLTTRPAAWVLVAALALPFAARAEDGTSAPDPLALPEPDRPADADGGVVQAGCVGCATNNLGGPPAPRGGCTACGPIGPCYPGREPCECSFDDKGPVLRLFGAFVNCVCCPDPCYTPKWNVLADAGFFTDGPRPVTQIRLRAQGVRRLPFPDKAEFFWARSDGKGKLRPPENVSGERRVEHSDLFIYTEGATGRAGLFVELDYRHIEPELFGNASGFADMCIGTKTLLLDCELIQFALEFRTFVPTGNFTRGLGTGHVSLEPSLLLGVKLAPHTYFQGQLSYWFPIGGDQFYQGPVYHCHAALNQTLYGCGRDVQLVGVLEMNGYQILGGNYTLPGDGTLSAKDVGNIFSIGPGLRLNICDVIDFGVGSAFSLTEDSIGEQIVRADFRWRF